MELLGGDFGEMSREELAAPVNTVAVSSRLNVSQHELREANVVAVCTEA